MSVHVRLIPSYRQENGHIYEINYAMGSETADPGKTGATGIRIKGDQRLIRKNRDAKNEAFPFPPGRAESSIYRVNGFL